MRQLALTIILILLSSCNYDKKAKEITNTYEVVCIIHEDEINNKTYITCSHWDDSIEIDGELPNFVSEAIVEDSRVVSPEEIEEICVRAGVSHWEVPGLIADDNPFNIDLDLGDRE